MITQSRILISGLRLRGSHGVWAQERRAGNDFVYDIVIEYDCSLAAVNDDISCTLNYAEAVEEIIKVNALPSRLLEHLAWRVDEALRHRWPAIDRLKIKVSKLQPPICADLKDVAIEIETNRSL